ncbi:MAG: tetratricopeptide repeat protein [Acidobacteriota bacterium]|nr:tetratricopeptide repeat protein [Acidobacteriota bacterium]
MGPGKDDPPRAAAVHLARFNRALVAEEEGDLETAKALLTQVIGREPQHAYATYEMGLIAIAEEDPAAAREWLEKAIRNVGLWAPTEGWPYPQGRYGYVRENAAFELGRLLIEAGEMDRAREILEPISKMVEIRAKAKKGHTKPPPKAPLEGVPDLRFENTPFYYAETLLAAGRKKEAVTLLKNFSRMRIGDKDLRAKARSRAKALR